MLKVIEIVILVKMYQRSLKNITSGKKKNKTKTWKCCANCSKIICLLDGSYLCLIQYFLASLRVPGADSDDETKTPSPSPHHGRSRPPSLIADSSSESDEGDARGEVRARKIVSGYYVAFYKEIFLCMF